MDENPVRKVKILGEELALYRDRSGAMGLLGLRCPHRLMSLEYGIPEEHGLRCGYHGWLFNEEGRCIQTPLEPPDSTFKEKVEALHYPVQEMAGSSGHTLALRPRRCSLAGTCSCVRAASARSSRISCRATGCR